MPTRAGPGHGRPAPPIDGLHHLGVPAVDPVAAGDWYATVFGFLRVLIEECADEVSTVLLDHPSGAQLLLRRATGPRAVGSSEFGFRVPDHRALQDWAGRLDDLDVEHGPVHRAHLGWALTLIGPDGVHIQLRAGAGPSGEAG
ncbi:VOC family protein [Nocardia sp. NPDC003963]